MPRFMIRFAKVVAGAICRCRMTSRGDCRRCRARMFAQKKPVWAKPSPLPRKPPKTKMEVTKAPWGKTR